MWLEAPQPFSKPSRSQAFNIVFSLAVLGILVPSALLGILTVPLAVLAHEASELLAVANGLRVAKG